MVPIVPTDPGADGPNATTSKERLFVKALTNEHSFD